MSYGRLHNLFLIRPDLAVLWFGGKGSPPPPPDYAGAAVAQGAANKETAIASAHLNNPNVINPNGTQMWTDGATPESRPTLTQSLSPAQEALYNKENQAKGLLGDLSISGAGSLNQVIGKNLDLSGAPQAPGSADATRNAVINAMMGRVNEDTARNRDQTNSDLVAAGIHPGSKAYDDRMAMIDRGYNDARQQAIIAGGSEAQRDFGMDTQRRKDKIAEILAGRQTPLNEITALMSGSQVNNPFAVPGAAQNTNIAPPPIFGAAQAEGQAGMNSFNQSQASRNAGLGGLFQLGAAGISAFPW